jgi:hypothetical protein
MLNSILWQIMPSSGSKEGVTLDKLYLVKRVQVSEDQWEKRWEEPSPAELKCINQWEKRWEEPLGGYGLSEDQWEKRWEEPSPAELKCINQWEQRWEEPLGGCGLSEDQ